MSSFTNFLASGLLEQAFGSVNYSASGNHYVALATGTPTNEGVFPEVTGSAYARVSVTNDAANWLSPYDSGNGDMLTENRQTITFPQSSGDWDTVVSFGIYDTLETGQGNLLGFGTLDTPQSIGVSNTASFISGALQITLN